MDTPSVQREPNQTVYLSNLNEKVRKDGSLRPPCISLSSPCLHACPLSSLTPLSDRTLTPALRIEALLVCPVLTVRPHPRHCRHQNLENARSGLHRLQRYGCCICRRPQARWFPLFRQANRALQERKMTLIPAQDLILISSLSFASLEGAIRRIKERHRIAIGWNI